MSKQQHVRINGTDSTLEAGIGYKHLLLPTDIQRQKKLGDEGNDPSQHSNQWKVSSFAGGQQRLIVAPARDHVSLLLKLGRVMEGPLRILYVLVVPRAGDVEPGRYELEESFTFDEAVEFFRRYERYFQEDGRHHVWLSAPTSGANIVYDRHDLLYLYGPLEEFKAVLAEEGLVEGDYRIPSPHMHYYNQVWDDAQIDLLDRYPTRYYPLRPSDEN